MTKKHPFYDIDQVDMEDKILNQAPDLKLLSHATSEEGKSYYTCFYVIENIYSSFFFSLAKNSINHLLQKDPKLRFLPTKRNLTDWAIERGGHNFFSELHRVRQNFTNEREVWFDGIDEQAKISDATYHPDNDKKEVRKIKKRARLQEDNPDSLFKRNQNYTFRSLGDIIAFNEERFFNRTLQKKRLIEVMDTHNKAN